MFDLSEFLKAESNTHQFTTDNVYLNQVGLGVFTTGTFYSYWNAKDKNGNYVNRGVIRDRNGDEIERFGVFIGAQDESTSSNGPGNKDHDLDEASEKWGTWEGWRKTEYTGTYEEQRWSNWSLLERNMISAYTFDQVPLDYFAHSLTSEPNPPLNINNRAIFEDDNRDRFKIGVTEMADLKDRIGLDPAKAEETGYSDRRVFFNLPGSFPNPILSIITMNEFMIDAKKKLRRTGDNGWKTLDGDSAEDYITRNEIFAMDEYLKDMKTSKYKSIICSGLLTFNLQMAGGQFQCPKTEWVTFRLNLFDAPPKRAPKAEGVLKSLNTAQIKTDPTGRKYLSREDGDSTTPDENNPSHKTVAPVKLSYNPYLNKWESGTTSVLAKIATPVARAVFNPTISVLDDADIAQILYDKSEELHFAASSGLAMPIQMQNGNPFQWAPGYAENKDCRLEEKTKQKLTVFNFNPKKSFQVDDMVLLSQIDGIWHIVPLGEDQDQEEVVEPSFAGQWEFTYLATTEDFFQTVKQNNQYIKLDPRTAEKVAHSQYYQLVNKKNRGIDYPDSDFDMRPWGTGITPNAQYENLETFAGGHIQFSSFDFMDNNIFGRRNFNALGTTLANEDAKGRTIPFNSEETIDNPRHSIYFGCLFPDGYDEDYVAGYATGVKNFNITYHNSGALIANERLPGLLNLGSEFFGGVGANTDNINIDPFQEEQFRDSVGEVLYYPERHDYRAPTSDPIDSDNLTGTPWTGREVLTFGPSMFYQYNEELDRKLEHLPADIALNASPENPDGAPLYNLNRLNDFYNQASVSDWDFRTKIRDAFRQSTWLVKTSGVLVDSGNYNPADSALGIKPNKPGNIQFRPLKMELYNSYNTEYKKDDVEYSSQGNAVGFDIQDDRFGEKFWSCDAAVQMASQTPPHADGFGEASYDRYKRLNYDTHPEIYINEFEENGTSRQLRPRLAFNKYVERNKPYYRRHERHYWDEDHHQWMGDFIDASAAYGIIGATTTVTVNDKIIFTTDQRFGMKSWMTYRFVGSNNLANDFNRRPVSTQYPSWGGENLKWDDHNTTTLAVTVYHHWPREQTIYDPRFFAVHHFNPRPDLEGYYTSSIPVEGDEPIRQGSPWPFTETAVFQNTDGTQIDFTYHTDPTNVGIREPSRIVQGSELPVPVTGSFIFKDGLSDGTALLPKDKSYLNVTRVGKLLPYQYTYYTISTAFASGDIISSEDFNSKNQSLIGFFFNGEEQPFEYTVDAQLAGLIYYSSLGTNAQPGDVIGNSSLGIFFSVSAVENNDPDNPEVVTALELECFGVGQDIPSSSFAKYGEPINSRMNGVQLTNLGGFGNGFSGKILVGKVQGFEGIDNKPKAVIREQQLSLPSDNTSPVTLDGGFAQPFGFVRGDLITEIQLADKDKSTDRKYDCFFLFKNDTSHTFFDNYIKGESALNESSSAEQYINLLISGE